jgi:hypothetical protein
MSTVSEYWHSAITDKSYALLTELRRRYRFVLIGGWAVYLHTRALKSKDIDFICDHETLSLLKESFAVVKNERLKKYEIKADGFDVDIYVPHFSELGLSAEEVSRGAVSIDGFAVPAIEKLLALKLLAHRQRKASLKGMKDRIDVMSLFMNDSFDFSAFNTLSKEHPDLALEDELAAILDTTFEMPELALNKKKFADLKRRVRVALGARVS